MTDKRFTVLKKLENSYIEADVIDTYIERLVKDGKSVDWVTVGILDKGNPITYKDCVDLLNENEQLKSFNQDLSENLSVCADKRLTQGNHLTKLTNENEQLKTTIQQLRTDNTKQKKLLNTTMKENEHIKTTIKDMINTERTQIGKNVLKQLYEAIQ